MKFISTKNKNHQVSAAEAIANGIAPDGGLYVPESFPTVSGADIDALIALDYPARAAFVIGKYLTEFDTAFLSSACRAAYDKFDGDPAPLVKTDEGLFFLELWHGPTHAFKDIALTLLPYLLTESKRLIGEASRSLILVATSGDTGKAALEGFSEVAGTDCVVFYPSDGVSDLQKLQMMTQAGDNVGVFGITGNFDDAQTAVKRLFADAALSEKLSQAGYRFSSANSINFGRLVPQIAYYFSAYCDLVAAGEIENGDRVDFCVPTGNFGNILAGYYAKRMGLPVGKLVCASNANRVLTDFILSGRYDIKTREFYKTTSPSMDILISSNLERLIFELSGRDDERTAARMKDLSEKGSYDITKAERDCLAADFVADCADEDAAAEIIADCFEDCGYIMDPHTAVAAYAAQNAKRQDTAMVIVSTASPYKFADDVLDALGERIPNDPFKALNSLEELTALPVPLSLSGLKTAEKRFTEVISVSNAAAAVEDYINRKGNKEDE